MLHKLSLVASAVFVSLLSVLPTASIAQDASLDDIMEAHIKALGGKEAIAKVETLSSKARVMMKGGFGEMEGTAEEIIDLKGKRLYTILDLGQYKKTDALVGDSGWSKGTDGEREMDAPTIAFTKMSLGVSPLLAAWETSKGALQVSEMEKFNDKQCHVVTVGSGIKYFVDAKSHLLEGLKIAGMGTVTAGDYEDVEGVMFPKQRTLKIEAQGISLDYNFSDTKTNVEIDDELFGDLADSKESDEPEYTTEQIMGLDKDGDEKISEQEARASPELAPAFALVDTNKDAFIDSKEVQAMLDYMKNQKASEGNMKKQKKPKVFLAGGGFKHGQYVKQKKGTPLCNLFVSMLNQSGIEAEEFGQSDGSLSW